MPGLAAERLAVAVLVGVPAQGVEVAETEVAAMLRNDLVVNNLVGWALTTGRVFLKSDGSPSGALLKFMMLRTSGRVSGPESFSCSRSVVISRAPLA